LIKQAKREADMGKRAKPVASVLLQLADYPRAMLNLALGHKLRFSLVVLICGFRAVRGTSLILGNPGSMLVHAHDGDIDHLPAPIATKCDRN
jgi:hypothetical protein